MSLTTKSIFMTCTSNCELRTVTTNKYVTSQWDSTQLSETNNLSEMLNFVTKVLIWCAVCSQVISAIYLKFLKCFSFHHKSASMKFWRLSETINKGRNKCLVLCNFIWIAMIIFFILFLIQQQQQIKYKLKSDKKKQNKQNINIIERRAAG